ncbi:hypothetical protein SUGI_0991480 [Cryptomeria japonica]|nr:hypothetical protein SUGI_0991480 [Cryptomeria japonica]
MPFHWKGAQCIRWRHKAVKNGIDDGHEVGSSAPKVDVDKLLAVAEVVCIAPSLILSVGFGIQSAIHKFQNVKSVTSTVPVNKHANMYITWQILPLLGALIIGAIIRTRQWRALTRGVKQSGKLGSPDFSLVQRVKKLEEDVGSSVSIVRVLSRQLEKLGVRFRVTRQTLRDPINETAALAQKTSEAVRALAMQEDVLEKELREIQHILFAMQEQQQKQLELLLTLGTVGRLQQETQHNSVHGEEKPGRVEMNPSQIPEVQATVQDTTSKCKGDDDLGRNTKEKSAVEGSGL